MDNDKNLPRHLEIPTVAVAPTRALTVKTRGLTDERGTRDAGEFDVLAIGWYGQESQPEPFAYLVRDPIQNEVFWIGQSLVEGVHAAR